ncbi:4Fe-4S dicluster domain-containing protein [Geodermatophilus ruber]|uniref:Formate dehydrogenase iron-sulfur subunit n=1 Tax=Geodermatophilus ruber TaxID=504800 RepID=A0A1I4ACB6_9ACTN|nr:4Fe-4S dicluster domain-containing protein [Geodermatophilus ruber]SFK54048.1 formate dehydrogenase iron-sulfur subunit [Geodermatophilus ruber]
MTSDAVTRELAEPPDALARANGYDEPPPRVGFFTDTSVCIGCKACEVACKEWNDVPDDGLDLLGMSFDNTGMLGANSWRHVAFVEQRRPAGQQGDGWALLDEMTAEVEPRLRAAPRGGSELGTTPLPTAPGGAVQDLGMPTFTRPGDGTGAETRTDFRWLMESDVCKHCTHAGCLDVCPTGALFRTEFGTVVVQQDICNGCGYCVSGCPYGVIDRSPLDGRAHKCTLCYDRLHDGLTPACAKACPTESIQFGDLDELRERADRRLADLHQQGVEEAQLYGRDPGDGVGGHGSLFLLLDDPEVYGMPPAPVVPTRYAPQIWRRVGAAAGAFALAAIGAFVSAAVGNRP